MLDVNQTTFCPQETLEANKDRGQTALTSHGDRPCRRSRPRSPLQSCSRRPEERSWRWQPLLCSVWRPAPGCPAGGAHATSESLTKQPRLMTAHLSIINTSSMYLRLGEHVKAPGAHFAISRDADQVVSILGSYHIHTVDWVLDTAEEHS